MKKCAGFWTFLGALSLAAQTFLPLPTHAQTLDRQVTPLTANEPAGTLVAPPANITDLLTLLKSYRPDVDRVRQLREQLALPVSDSGEPKDLAVAWHRKAIVAEQLQEIELRYDYLARALEHARQVQQSDSGLIGSYLRVRYEYAGSMRPLKGIAASQDSYLDFLKEIEARAKRMRGWQFNILDKLTQGYIGLGDIENAQKAIERMQATLKAMAAQPDNALHVPRWQQQLEAMRGEVLHAQGREVESELAMQATLRLGDEVLRVNSQREAAGIFAAPTERIAAFNDAYAIDLAKAYIGQDRLNEAEITLRETLKRALLRDGRNSVLVGKALNNLAVVLLQRGRANEGRIIAQWADKTMADAGMSAMSPPRANNRILLANAWVASGHPDKAVVVLDELRSTLANDARLEAGFGHGSLLSIRAYLLTGRTNDALRDGENLVRHLTHFYGGEHYVVAEARAYRAMALRRAGRLSEARGEFENATRVLLDPTKTPGKQQANAARTKRLNLILTEYLEMLVGPGVTATSSDRALAFMLADVARWQSVQKAVTSAALRTAAGSVELADRIKQVQDDEDELQATYKNLISQRSAPPDRQLPAVIKAMEVRIDALQKAQQSNLASIRKQFPQYDALVSPRPADMASAIRALHPKEALLSIFATANGSYVWGLGSDGTMRFHVSEKGTEWIAQRVKALRTSVDLTSGADLSTLRYDMQAATDLYQEFVAPVASAFSRADTLLVVANDALGQIPFSLLPTGPIPPQLRGGVAQRLSQTQFRAAPWLLRQWAVAYLPSISNLVTLRSIGASANGRSAFIGYGDPDFGEAVSTGSTRRLVSQTRNLIVSASSNWQEPLDALADTDATLNAAQPTALKPPPVGSNEPVLTPLPDTRDEISAIATALKADLNSDVFFGVRANRQNVMSADLKKRRIVAFATHGLVAGDLPGLEQPALALSPSPGHSIAQGLLKLDDILKLSLDADLVVLSACNTAAADGTGAEAVSGLGRGFFYAGARSVLATHWPVETVSARKLVTHLFESYVQDAKMTRAQALRRAMLNVLDDQLATDGRGAPQADYAHPAFWAPYALYGDPGR